MIQTNYTPAKIYPPTLDLKVKKWYVEYRYMNPLTFQRDRFKVYEDINRHTGKDKIEYATLLKDSVNQLLRDGYNPFSAEQQLQEQQEHDARQAASDEVYLPANYTVIQAANYFLTKKAGDGKAKSTMDRYRSHIYLFLNHVNDQYGLLTRMSDITADQILSFLQEKTKSEGWVNKTYNNYLGTYQAWLNHISKNIHGIIEKNPIQGAETKSTLSNKHAAYTDQHLSWILTAVRKRKDYYMEGLILTGYYAAVRSKEEMMALRAGNVLYDRNLLLLDASGTKGRREDYIPLDPNLKEFYRSRGFDKLPADWYLFGNCGAPGPTPASSSYYSRMFREYRDNLKLNDRYTLYGFKHTRGIHLAESGVDPYAIMQLFRHKSLDQTMTYLRDLGCTINRKATENSRKI